MGVLDMTWSPLWLFKPIVSDGLSSVSRWKYFPGISWPPSALTRCSGEWIIGNVLVWLLLYFLFFLQIYLNKIGLIKHWWSPKLIVENVIFIHKVWGVKKFLLTQFGSQITKVITKSLQYWWFDWKKSKVQLGKWSYRYF